MDGETEAQKQCQTQMEPQGQSREPPGEPKPSLHPPTAPEGENAERGQLAHHCPMADTPGQGLGSAPNAQLPPSWSSPGSQLCPSCAARRGRCSLCRAEATTALCADAGDRPPGTSHCPQTCWKWQLQSLHCLQKGLNTQEPPRALCRGVKCPQDPWCWDQHGVHEPSPSLPYSQPYPTHPRKDTATWIPISELLGCR